MPRVALIYTGFLRSWDLCKANHIDYIHSENTDCFFYTDKDPQFPGVFHQIQDLDFYPDPFKDHRYATRKRPENTVYQTFRQWHANFVGFCLVPRGYDIYCRIRTDIKFNGKLHFHEYDCSGNTIYIPDGNDYGGVNDQFAFGNYEVMKTYYSVYVNCHELWNDGVEWHSEGMQLSNLQRNKINISRFGSPQQHIMR